MKRASDFKCVLIAPVFIVMCVACVETVYEDDNLSGDSIAGEYDRYELPPIPEDNINDIVGEPAAGEPTAGEPTAGEPTAGEPAAGEPAAGEPAAGEPAAGEVITESSFPDYAIEMLAHVNEFRSTGGACGGPVLPPVAPLMLNRLLNQAALAHAEDMGRNNYFSHDSQDGRTPWDRIAATGYTGTAMGENIAAGRGDALSAFEQWRGSPGHCQNMLSADFTELGVGYANINGSQFSHYWVQNFARPR